MNKAVKFLLSFSIGLINALLGAGGGIVAVSLFKATEISQKKAQAASLTVMLPLSIISVSAYLYMGHFSLSSALVYLPFGLIGSIAGTMFLKKIPDKALSKIFAVFMIYSGIHMLMR